MIWSPTIYGVLMTVLVVLVVLGVVVRSKRPSMGPKRAITVIVLCAVTLTPAVIAVTYTALVLSEPYRTAVTFLEADATVREHVGTVRSHYLVESRTFFSNPEFPGYWGIKFRVRGDKRTGYVIVGLLKSDSTWEVRRCELVLKNRRAPVPVLIKAD